MQDATNLGRSRTRHAEHDLPVASVSEPPTSHMKKGGGDDTQLGWPIREICSSSALATVFARILARKARARNAFSLRNTALRPPCAISQRG
jgi:hypothetical protein